MFEIHRVCEKVERYEYVPSWQGVLQYLIAMKFIPPDRQEGDVKSITITPTDNMPATHLQYGVSFTGIINGKAGCYRRDAMGILDAETAEIVVDYHDILGHTVEHYSEVA